MSNNDDVMIQRIKGALRSMDAMPEVLDKTNPQYKQSVTDALYSQLKRLKTETANKLNNPMPDADKTNYETLLQDLDEHLGKLELVLSNKMVGLSGGKRKYKKRSCKKGKSKSKRCNKKRRATRRK